MGGGPTELYLVERNCSTIYTRTERVTFCVGTVTSRQFFSDAHNMKIIVIIVSPIATEGSE